MSNIFGDTVSYLTTGTNWTGTEDSEGLLVEIGQHIGYTFYAVAVAALIAIPIGLLIGHTGKGEVAVVGLVNVLRSLPTLGLLLLFILWMGLGLTPTIIALILLAIPPLLAGTYAGVANVDKAVVDASRAMGMSHLQVLLRVESKRTPTHPGWPAQLHAAGGGNCSHCRLRRLGWPRTSDLRRARHL